MTNLWNNPNTPHKGWTEDTNKMKYTIRETIDFETIHHGIVKDFKYTDVTEQEFLVRYLKDPKMNYITEDSQGVKRYYNRGELEVTRDGDKVINHTIASHLRRYP
jgi:hypothetical protein